MSLGSSIIATIVAFIVLLIIGVSLIGIVVDGFVQPDASSQELEENISQPKSILITILFCLVILAYFYALYNFWNIGIVVAALMLMVSRIPQLVFESKTGTKLNRASKPKKAGRFNLQYAWMAGTANAVVFLFFLTKSFPLLMLTRRLHRS